MLVSLVQTSGGYNKTCKLGSDRLQIITVVFFKYV